MELWHDMNMWLIVTSPKRSRRDRKTLEEKLSRNSSSHVEDNKDRDQKHGLQHEGQDMIPHECSSALDSKPEYGVSKGANRNSDRRDRRTKHSMNPTEVPRSRSYFQVCTKLKIVFQLILIISSLVFEKLTLV